MPIASFIEHSYIGLLDLIFNRLRQPTPSAEALKRCKIIAHRGEHDTVRVKENTLAAFDQAAGAGLWGVELDVRWTRDMVPVVAHDPDLRRVWGHDAAIVDLSREQLKRMEPEIPSLREVVARFGARLHLMIEIKQNPWPDPSGQIQSLREHLASLRAVTHYHFMALHPMTLDHLRGFPGACLVCIAYYLPYQYSQWVMRNQWGGLCAHYGMMSRAVIAKHHRQGQSIGTAYPSSRNCLFREINRGVDWIFSNHAAALQRIVQNQLKTIAR
ncbi:MAG: glycerophosphodiester phosphodiesterase [Desulfobacteraceae bacterium]|nr:glycerophosphodiester phosphodiesterase [Desulfobacteraceae bacterium]